MKTVRRTNACICFALIVILMGGICAVLAQPSNGIKLNQNASAFAARLIEEGHVVADGKGAWSTHRPSADEENEFIRVHGFDEYAKWHLGIDDRYPENTKRRYKFPYGDFRNVHRCGLLAAQARARQYGYVDIEKAAAELERAMKVQAGDSRGLFTFTSSSVFHPCKSVALDLPGR
jgi:hypothetical protein